MKHLLKNLLVPSLIVILITSVVIIFFQWNGDEFTGFENEILGQLNNDNSVVYIQPSNSVYKGKTIRIEDLNKFQPTSISYESLNDTFRKYIEYESR
jgi:hypothetical protein